LNDFSKVDSTGQFLLRIWREGIDDHNLRLAAMNNLAISAAYQGDMATSDSIFRQVYRDARAVENSRYIQRALINLGTLKGMSGDLDSAYYFLNSAALEAKESGDYTGLVEMLINLSNIDMDRENYDRVEILLDSAYWLAENEGDLDLKATTVDNLATLRANQGRWEEAYDTLRSYTEMREEYLNEERLRSVAEMQEKYESERKARIIQQLEIDNLDSEMENVRIRTARNRLMYLGGFILLVAIGLLSRLAIVRRSRAAIQREKDIADGLLLNILPAAVAEELKEKGRTEARYYDTATIMFSDFKNFTDTASHVSAEELVNSINIYFRAFDEIMTRNGIEKIKTIGDSYMAAGGIDELNPVKATDVVLTALEIRDFVMAQHDQREEAGLVAFDMRVGVHSGPVVAGIVGVKKFQYDLWGDTVNIASRMETTGEPGKVNISESTYQLIKDDPRFIFKQRGMLDVKGKGRMMMYFVERSGQEN
jgi:class 3 adenylate cyclase